MSDKLLLGCENGANYKNNESSTVTCNNRVKCLRLIPNTNGVQWVVNIRYNIHHHGLAKALEDHDIPDCLKVVNK